jgi:hypothetical protein
VGVAAGDYGTMLGGPARLTVKTEGGEWAMDAIVKSMDISGGPREPISADVNLVSSGALTFETSGKLMPPPPNETMTEGRNIDEPVVFGGYPDCDWPRVWYYGWRFAATIGAAVWYAVAKGWV